MRNLILTSVATLVMVASSHADLAISGPGMSSAIYLTGTQVSDYKGYLAADGVSENFERLEVTAIEWQLSAGASTDNQWGSKTKNNGDYHNRAQAGTSRCTITLSDMYSVNGGTRRTYQTHDFSLTNVRSENDKNSGFITFDPPLVFEDCILGYTVNQNMVHMTGDNSNGDSISYIIIHGTATGAAVPTGKIDVDALTNAGDYPPINWEITRVAEPIETPVIAGSSVGESESGSPSSDTVEPVKPKTNNGHGNNIDGVDVSNPGKSAEKWELRGIIDESGEVDDEK